MFSEGPSNTGKTILVERILERLAEEPFYCHYEIYQCTRNKGKKVRFLELQKYSLFYVTFLQLMFCKVRFLGV